MLIISLVGSSPNVITKRLWKHNVEAHVLDIGSLIDAVAEQTTRTWIRLKRHTCKKYFHHKIHKNNT